MELPYQAVKCTLAGVNNPDSWSDDALEKFDCFASKELIAQIVTLEEVDDAVKVVLLDGHLSINEEMRKFIPGGGQPAARTPASAATPMTPPSTPPRGPVQEL